jgi:hypothetical protein
VLGVDDPARVIRHAVWAQIVEQSSAATRQGVFGFVLQQAIQNVGANSFGF